MTDDDLPEPEEMARLDALFQQAEAAGATLYEFVRDDGVYAVACKTDDDAREVASLNPGTLKAVNIRTGETVWQLHSTS